VKPFIVKEPKDVTALAGESAEFVCKVDGDPTPTILWSRADGRMPHGRAHILDDRSLRIEDLEYGDEGMYICHAENVVGSLSAQAQLIVHCTFHVSIIISRDAITLSCLSQLHQSS
jgi:roundabout axon guidance receptor 2